MASINKKTTVLPTTRGGLLASRITPIQILRRTVLTCFLWESNAYEEGQSVVNRINQQIPKCDPQQVAELAIEARFDMKLRHVPLQVVREMARYPEHKKYVKDTLARICNRPDQMTEFLALYWKDGKQPISAQVKKGLAEAFTQFDEYQLAKYNRDSEIKLKDVLFLCHAKPKDQKQADLWKRLINNELAIPDTWEVGLSSGADKHSVWTRLLKEKKLGYLALLKNIRNMSDVGVDMNLVEQTLCTHKGRSTVLPMRFISAADHNPEHRDMIEKAMLSSMQAMPKLTGKTIICVDVSGSMGRSLSTNSKLTRYDTAILLAMLTREVCEDPHIYATAGDDRTRVQATCRVPDAHGFKMRENVMVTKLTIGGGGIFLLPAMDWLKQQEKTADRIIVLTDEQDCSGRGFNPNKADAFGTHNYIINVSNNKNGIAYGTKWLHINGHSENIIKYIQEYESIL